MKNFGQARSASCRSAHSIEYRQDCRTDHAPQLRSTLLAPFRPLVCTLLSHAERVGSVLPKQDARDLQHLGVPCHTGRTTGRAEWFPPGALHLPKRARHGRSSTYRTSIWVMATSRYRTTSRTADTRRANVSRD